jgi:hypothetical protein
METIRTISCSIPKNRAEEHFIDKPTDFPCTSTQNVQKTNIAISHRNKCAEKPQDEVITKPEAPKKIKIKQISMQKILFEIKH